MVHLLGPGEMAGHGDHTGVVGRGRQGLLGQTLPPEVEVVANVVA